MQKYINEQGRSMVEMLGVLAIIGILSIGGIHGYRYAMTKYRSNQILNELNIASHQLATKLLTANSEVTELSLGEPYDTGYLTSANYAFDYGCGNNVDADTCGMEETGYWFALNGVPDEICKNMINTSDGMPYLAEQELNGSVVTDGTGCLKENNAITFLFNSDGTGTLSEGMGETGEDEFEDEPEDQETTPVCPQGTSSDGKGGLAQTVTDGNGAEIECYCKDENTGYTDSGECETLSAICKDNGDCNRGYYCDITYFDMGEGAWHCNENSERRGTCRNAKDDLKDKPTGAPFYISNRPMWWWSADHFCKALGKTLVSVSDYDCVKGSNGYYGNYCYNDPNADQNSMNIDETKLTENVKKMYNAYGYYPGWTSTESWTECRKTFIGFNGTLVSGRMDNDTDLKIAVCR